MSRNHRTPDIKDSDLQQVFRRQARQPVPGELDKRILQAAAEAMDRDPQTEKSDQNSFVWYKGLAVAALLLLSVSVVPLLTQYHRPELSEPGAPALLNEQEVVQGVGSTSMENSVELKTRQSREASSLKEFAAPPAIKSAAPVTEADTAKRFSSPASDSATLGGVAVPGVTGLIESEESDREEAQPMSGYGYRQFPQSWFSYIDMLEKHGRQDEAAQERKLFEQTFPDYKPD